MGRAQRFRCVLEIDGNGFGWNTLFGVVGGRAAIDLLSDSVHRILGSCSSSFFSSRLRRHLVNVSKHVSRQEAIISRPATIKPGAPVVIAVERGSQEGNPLSGLQVLVALRQRILPIDIVFTIDPI